VRASIQHRNRTSTRPPSRRVHGGELGDAGGSAHASLLHEGRDTLRRHPRGPVNHDLFGWGWQGLLFRAPSPSSAVTGEVLSPPAAGPPLEDPLERRASSSELAGAALRPSARRAAATPTVEGRPAPDLSIAGRGRANRPTDSRPSPAVDWRVGNRAPLRGGELIETPSSTKPGTGLRNRGELVPSGDPRFEREAAGKKTRSRSRQSTRAARAIADMYSDLTGGLLFPSRSQPTGPSAAHEPSARVHAQPSTAAISDIRRRPTACARATGRASSPGCSKLPADSRTGVSGSRGRTRRSDPATSGTSRRCRGGGAGIYTHAWYYDGSLFVAVTEADSARDRPSAHVPDLWRRRDSLELASELGMTLFF